MEAPSNIHDRFSKQSPPSEQVSTLLSLPAELLQQILAHLSPVSLVLLSRTSQSLRSHACDEHLWRQVVQDQLPDVILRSPSPCQTFRELYMKFQPYWFLPKNKVWFSDEPNIGRLVIARFDPERGAIEAYELIANVERREFSLWEWDSDVAIHSFDPVVRLWRDQPIVRLEGGAGPSSFKQDVRMQLGLERGVFSEFSFARSIPPENSDSRMELWPPYWIPAEHRVRNISHDGFQGLSHKPRRLSEVCDSAFRIKKWVEFRPSLGSPMGVRMGEEVRTYSTLPKRAYMPTTEKPWNGIWVGDYSGHGCEFLLLEQFQQPSRTITRSPSPASYDADIDETGNGLREIQYESVHYSPHPLDTEGSQTEENASQNRKGSLKDRHTWKRSEWQYKEALRGIKLTGDPNVPRGQISFIATDIGQGGLIRVADEEIFRGARIVKSQGHIAGHGFRNDKYIPSQLIMISHNRLAQYWEVFGHISYYQRVDIDKHIE